MNRTHLAGTAIAALLLCTTAACSDDESGIGAPSAPATSSVGDAGAGGDGGDGGQPLPGTDADLGYCRVDITGDVSTSFTGPGGAAAVGYGPWTAAAFPGQDVGVDESFFLLNCIGEGATGVNVILRQGYTVPMAPATYPIVASVNQLGMSDEGPITMIVSIDGSETNWGAASDGTFVITEFDGEHIAGNFTLPIRDVLLADGTDSGTATVTGEFDLRNPN